MPQSRKPMIIFKKVTIGGWIVTFIIDVRGGGPSSGYISAGFFGGRFSDNRDGCLFVLAFHVD